MNTELIRTLSMDWLWEKGSAMRKTICDILSEKKRPQINMQYVIPIFKNVEKFVYNPRKKYRKIDKTISCDFL